MYWKKRLSLGKTKRMLFDLTTEQAALKSFMSEISERCYSAGWMQGLEYVLWGALSDGEREYGHYFITAEDIQQLKLLSSRAACWIYMDDRKEETAIELDSWKAMYSLHLQKMN